MVWMDTYMPQKTVDKNTNTNLSINFFRVDSMSNQHKSWSLCYLGKYIPVIILHLSIVAKPTILLQRSHNYGAWNYWQQKLLYCICYTIWIDWHMIFGLEQDGGSLVAPMALAHPLHPIDNRSRNRRRNLWFGWCVSSWWPLFPSRNSVLIYIYMYMHFLYEFCCRTYINIQQECHSESVKLRPITFYRTVFLGNAQFLGWMTVFVFF